MHAFDAILIKQWAIVIIREELFLGAVDDFTMLVWRVLWLGWCWMVVLYEEVLDVTIHGRSACAFGVVPIQVNSGKLVSCPVRGDIVVCEQGLEEMVGMEFVRVLDSKVIDDEDKDKWPPVVAQESRHDGTLVVTVFCEARGE